MVDRKGCGSCGRGLIRLVLVWYMYMCTYCTWTCGNGCGLQNIANQAGGRLGGGGGGGESKIVVLYYTNLTSRRMSL